MKLPWRVTAVITIGACFAAALPVLAAISLAQRQAIEREEAYIASLARSALRPSELAADQLDDGARIINELTRQEACSDRGLDLMREIDLRSTLLQAVGRVEGDVIKCSSFGGRRAFSLGEADLISTSGAVVRADVKLLDANTSYLVVVHDSFVGIVHKDLPLSFVDQIPGLNVGVFSWSTRRLLMARGEIAPRWIGPEVTDTAVFRSGDHLVAAVRSEHYDLGAVAAVPLAHTAGFAREAAMLLIPLGFLAGIALSAVLVHVVRASTSMPAMIRHGLKTQAFHLVYQPVVDLETERIVGAEALIRWRPQRGEPIPPDIFIPVAEEAGVIHLITARVLELLSEDAKHVLSVEPRFCFGVNFSATDFHRRDVIVDVRRFVARSGVGFGNLLIEATERSFVDIDRAQQTIRELRAAGVKVAIDDFGTGYSSLGYLAQLEIDCLKIDKLFVQSLGTDAATSQVAARIIDMAKDLNLRIVAEGVETAEQAQYLKRMNVNCVQGYLYGRPMPLEDLLQRLREGQNEIVRRAAA